MEAWRKVFREGIVPHVSVESLVALKMAIVHDDPALTQGVTTIPPMLQTVGDWPVECACALGYLGMQEGMETVQEVDQYFAQMCAKIDTTLGIGASRMFLNAYDSWSRDEIFNNLVPELDFVIKNSGVTAA